MGPLGLILADLLLHTTNWTTQCRDATQNVIKYTW